MRHATLPSTELQVSSISLGTAALGSVVDRTRSFALLDAFVQAVGTFIDIAHPFVGIPVIGSLTQEQLHNSLAGADLRLTPEQLGYLVDGEERDAT